MNKENISEEQQLREVFPGGKENPFEVPADFFETITGKTLQRAKEKERNSRKARVLWFAISAAASIAALFSLSVLLQNLEKIPASSLVAQDTQQVFQPMTQPVSIPKKEIVERKVATATPNKLKISKTPADKELIGDVLSDLTEDELVQMVAMYKTDPLTSESIQ
jgi:hypothetical protein